MKPTRIQVLMIHGGMTFTSKRDYLNWLRRREVVLEKEERWSDHYLARALGTRFHVIRPRMPLSENAKYDEWVIQFEKYVRLLGKKFVLIGTSLGGIFLAKYLSEHRWRKRPLATYLVCPPYDDTLPGEDLAGGFRLKGDLSLLQKNAGRLRLLFSASDDVVPSSHADKYAMRLKHADIIVYDHITGHFEVSELPEIVKMIKRDCKQHITS